MTALVPPGLDDLLQGPSETKPGLVSPGLEATPGLEVSDDMGGVDHRDPIMGLHLHFRRQVTDLTASFERAVSAAQLYGECSRAHPDDGDRCDMYKGIAAERLSNCRQRVGFLTPVHQRRANHTLEQLEQAISHVDRARQLKNPSTRLNAAARLVTDSRAAWAELSDHGPIIDAILEEVRASMSRAGPTDEAPPDPRPPARRSIFVLIAACLITGVAAWGLASLTLERRLAPIEDRQGAMQARQLAHGQGLGALAQATAPEAWLDSEADAARRPISDAVVLLDRRVDDLSDSTIPAITERVEHDHSELRELETLTGRLRRELSAIERKVRRLDDRIESSGRAGARSR